VAGSLAEGRRVFLIVPERASDWARFADADLDTLDHRSFALRPAARWVGWETEADASGERQEMVWRMLEVTVRPGPAAGAG
jgi:hypothetical protein